MKRTLDTREDIYFLISTFYSRVRQDELLGPVFNTIIQHWPEHLEKLTDFWETNLLFTRNYKGNPIQAHSEADRQIDNSISMEHFGRWLQLWFSTIDKHFKGLNAEKTKKSRQENVNPPVPEDLREQRLLLIPLRPETINAKSSSPKKGKPRLTTGLLLYHMDLNIHCGLKRRHKPNGSSSLFDIQGIYKSLYPGQLSCMASSAFSVKKRKS
ncbi:hypothetical protein D770_22255 [Flammeovirgaceae bacterium 311]|nr:hypothetical protein D770_22255 [Flammeovirgaceae bacterium 311]